MNEFIKVLQSEEIGNLYVHWPELEVEKINKINTRRIRKYKSNGNFSGKPIIYNIFDVPPILLMPFKNGYMILNGKYRAFLSYRKGYNLLAYIVYNISDLLNRIPKEVIGDHSVKSIGSILNDKEQRKYALCKKYNRVHIKNLDLEFKLPDRI